MLRGRGKKSGELTELVPAIDGFTGKRVDDL
jgi:hypothetical protein